MTRKAPVLDPEAPAVERSPGSLAKVSSEPPLKRTKLSLERLIAETPANKRDDAWEKMVPVGLEL